MLKKVLPEAASIDSVPATSSISDSKSPLLSFGETWFGVK
jgi:hypothetical protein